MLIVLELLELVLGLSHWTSTAEVIIYHYSSVKYKDEYVFFSV